MQYGESTDVVDTVRMTFERTDVQPRRQHGDRVDREYTQRVRRLWREYVGSTDSADTVRMCCSTTDTVRTSAMFMRILKCDNFDCGKSFAFCIQTEHSNSTARKKMWQTQDKRKLLLFMQLFQQWLQVAAATLHLEELEERKRRRKEDRRRREARRRTRRQRTQWVRQWLLRRPTYGQYEKIMHELTTEDQTSFKNFLKVDPDIFMELLHRAGPRTEKK